VRITETIVAAAAWLLYHYRKGVRGSNVFKPRFSDTLAMPTCASSSSPEDLLRRPPFLLDIESLSLPVHGSLSLLPMV
jgi:hypothetical protein